MRSKILLVGAAVVLVAVACTIPPPPPPPPEEPPPPPPTEAPPPPTTTTTRPTTTTTTPPPPLTPSRFGHDYDGDGRADLVWIDTANSHSDWYLGYPGSARLLFAGEYGDIPVPADYDGDGRTEIVVVRNGQWLKSDGTVIAAFGSPAGSCVRGADPVPRDYDGDGRAEPAWYRYADATWWIGNNAPVTFGQGPTDAVANEATCVTGGIGGLARVDYDAPVPADYDGDGRADLSTYSPVTGEWRVRSSRDQAVSTVTMRAPTLTVQLPAPGDYDDVGHAQRALVDARGWLIEGHASVEPLPAGVTLADPIVPALGDYDGDGRADRSFWVYTWVPTPGADVATWYTVPSIAPAVLGAGTGRYPSAVDVVVWHSIGRFTLVEQDVWELSHPCCGG